MVLGWVETLIPLDLAIPGIKIGLGNGVLVFAVFLLGVPAVWILMILKVLLYGLLFGGVNAMIYSLAGGIVSVAGMLLVNRIKGTGPVAVSMVGGALHNAGQVGIAMAITQTNLLVYMAVLLAVGLGTGLVMGLCARPLIKRFGPMLQQHGNGKRQRRE